MTTQLKTSQPTNPAAKKYPEAYRVAKERAPLLVPTMTEECLRRLQAQLDKRKAIPRH